MPHELTPPGRITLDVAARTHPGVERSNNEDRVLVADLCAARGAESVFEGCVEVNSGGVLLAVCDGIGGAAGGEIASGPR
jgi:PPM family protein phosphatase